MNLLEMICQKLGVEIGEEWESVDGNEYCILYDGTIQANGQDFGYQYWGDIFDGLIKPVWKPEWGEFYYLPIFLAQEYYTISRWANSDVDKRAFDRGLVFKTKEEAIACTEKMLEAIKEE